MSVSFSRSSESPIHTTRFTDALAAVRPELAALDASKLDAVNLDIPSATVTAIGVVPELRAYHDAIERRFDREEAARIEMLELYARAASQAHAAYLAAQGAVPDLQSLSRRCVELRTMLLADATSLSNRKVIAADRLAGLQGAMGFKNQVTDLQQLVSIFEEHWARIQGISPVRREDLEAAEDAANALFVAMGQREQAPPAVTDAADVRQRAFTLFVRTYDELRRAISYLRWHEDDVDAIIPSLWSGKAQRKRDAADPAPAPSPEPTPSPSDEPTKDPVRPFGPDFPSPFEDEPST